ncbi:hypothetical protein SAMN05421803_1083 [Nocardiopsis flavescens]|uniref:Uncharacterized protein n=1 Tax=Nocardiopsis flavescens TaxID=758803 RepID=A0A1M6KXU3_9ACTN|nr:hypothetical protein [Nocardiopsis flavescens]SHJ63788.1 hypothetical protein SAMN05421803_1083 [Nocardiopsis flavescens]
MPQTAEPTPQARAWASRTAAEHGFPDRAEDILARLHLPGLPEAVTDLHTRVRENAEKSYRGPRLAPLLPEGRGPRAVTDPMDADLLGNMHLWCLLVTGQRSAYYAGELPLLKSDRLYGSLADHLLGASGPWNEARTALLLDATLLGLIPLRSCLRICEALDDAVLEPHLERVRALRTLAYTRAARYRTRANPVMDALQIRALALLLRLGDPRPMGEVFPAGDLFGDLLRDEHPGLYATPGLADLFVHLLTPPGTHPGKKWRLRTTGLLNALEDPAATVRALLTLVPGLPGAPAESGEAQSPYLRPHVHDILNGVVRCVDLLPEASVPWAVQTLEPVAVFTGTGPGGSKLLRAERMATAVVKVLGLRGGEPERDALIRIRAQVTKKTLLRSIDGAIAQIAAPAGAPPAGGPA